jgi:RND family efflux transporter MFP subunit
MKKENIKSGFEKLIRLFKTSLTKLANVVGRFAVNHRQGFISLVILFSAVLIFYTLIKLRKPPERIEQQILAPLVKTEQVHVEDIQMIVSGYGTVQPKVEVEIAPQVVGKVISINPQFRAGGFIRAGEQILQIDPRDYELAVQQAEAGVADALVKLDLEKAEAAVALDEWQQLHPGTEPASPLVLREPQIRQAEALLESAKAALAIAELSLERTSLSLPVDVRIVTESVDLGQFVSTGRVVGSAYGIEAVEIEVPLEDKELAWLDIPDEIVSFNSHNPSGRVSIAEVKAEFAGSNHTWKGKVSRTTGQVDRTSRLISVVIEVSKPFDASEQRPALLPGTFVEVLIRGSTLKNAVAVPRDAIHNGNEVWVVKDGRLYIRQVNIVRADRDFAYTTSGLCDKDIIVVSSLDTVVDGMRIRVKK